MVANEIEASGFLDIPTELDPEIQDEYMDRYGVSIPKRYHDLFERARSGRSMKVAIQAMCLECTVFSPSDVETCPFRSCPVYKFRNG